MSNSREVKNPYKDFCNGAAAGALGGVADVVFCYPFFGRKIHEQIQTTKITPCFSLFRSYQGALIYGAVIIPSTAVMYGITNASQSFLPKDKSYDMKSAVAGGVLSGFLSGILTTPLTNILAQRKLNPTLTSRNAFQALRAQGGWKRLYFGFTPNSIGDGIFSIGAFCGVPKAKEYLIKKCEFSAYQAHFLASLIAGSFAAFVSHPADTTATFMGANGISSTPKAIKEIFKKNSLYGFYPGLFWRTAYIASSILAVSTTVDATNAYIEETQKGKKFKL